MDEFFKKIPEEDDGQLPNAPKREQLLKEVIIDKSGQVRQAGSLDFNSRFIKLLKKKAETDLFFFARSILGLDRLTTHLHKAVCHFIQKIPPYRKLILLPRDTFKSTSIHAICLTILFLSVIFYL